MKGTIRLAALFIAIAALALGAKIQGAQAKEESKEQTKAESAANNEARRLEVTTKPWKGDFDGMLERRAIRFYVPYSRSLYFVDKGRERGISAYL
ncbi:MAG TPA: lytic transglycosylase F, partial [Burkholderiaceae bacterium]|nr:lytic transglycosylase F [Burkholderiaceae bacterium]